MRSLQITTAKFQGLFTSSFRKRGDIARDQREWLKAAEAYQRHLAQHPEDSAIWVQLGHANKEDGDYDSALAAYRRAEALIGDDADLQLSLGHLFKRTGRIDLALAAYQTSAELAPGLFGGEAMIQIEQLLGRLAWISYDQRKITIGAGLTGLIGQVEAAEANGRKLFSSYFHSFEAY